MTQPSHKTPASQGDNEDFKRETERWFIQHGLPHLVDRIRSSHEILTSTTPFLILVFFLEIFFLEFDLLFTRHYPGVAQFAILFGTAVGLLLLIAGINKLLGRRLLQLPKRLGGLELAIFLVLPSLLAGFDRGYIWILWVFIINISIAVLIYLSASYALLPMLRWGFIFMLRQLRQVVHLTARSLPLLLLISFFVFLNAEMWQVANDFEIGHYMLIIALVLGVGLMFFSISIPSEAKDLEKFSGWPEVFSRARQSNAPCVSQQGFWEKVEDDEKAVEFENLTPLTNRARRNVWMLLFFSSFVRVIIVGTSIGAFFMIIGWFAVGSDTIVQWTTNITREDLSIIFSFDILGGEIVMTEELLYTSGLIAALSSLQFALLSITNDVYKKQFFEDIADEVKSSLAVREIYIRHLV